MRENLELFVGVRGSDDSNLDVLVSEFSLEAVLQGKNGGVDGIFDVKVV